MEDFHKVNEQKQPRIGSKPFVYFQPDFTELNELYRVNDEPINIINNAENVPFLQNVAQQQLVDVSSPSLDTSALSDVELASSVIPRYVEVSEIADASRSNLEDAIKQLSNVKPVN